MRPERIQDWVRQFGDDDLIDAALRSVQQVRLIGRPEVVDSVQRFISLDTDFAAAAICPLGGPKDSSYLNTYFAQDVTNTLGLVAADLPVALLHDDPIVFVDDFIGSGRQAVDILESWLGVERTGSLHEARDPLPDLSLVDRLRSRRLAFIFAAGVDGGAQHLRARAAELGLDVTVSIGVPEDQLPRAFETVDYGSDERKRAFRAACEEIARNLLTSQGQDPSTIPDRLLGYGNRGFLVTFPYNTPAQTLTCLWASGETSGFGWLPLLPRRRKA